MADEKTSGLKLPLRLSLDDLRWLFVLIVAGISWGLKIEFSFSAAINRIEDFNRAEHARQLARIQEIEKQLAVGVLPRADERISALEREHVEIDRRLHDLEKR